MNQKATLDISTGSIIRVVLVLLSLWLLYFVRDIIAIIFVSIIVASALSPVVDKICRSKCPRVLAVIFVYLIILGIISAAVYFVVPPLIVQIKQLAELLPDYLKTFGNLLANIRSIGNTAWLNASQETLNSVSNFLGGFLQNIFNTTIGFFNGAAALAVIFILTLYLVLDENGVKKFFVSMFPIKQKTRLMTIGNKIGMKLGGWLRGQIILGVIVGVIVYVGLLLMHIPYALTLGIFAGVLEIIPIIGPIISAVPAILIAFTIAPTTALMVTIFYIIVQELENKLLVPKVMQYTVGLNPISIIIIILVGAKLMGILGMLLAVPVASVFYVILEEWPLMGGSKK